MPYGEVPIIHASAAVQRVVGIVYALVWAWDEHRRTAEELGIPATGQVVMLVDEVELHLHPKWQRKIFQMLRAGVETLGQDLSTQYIVTTHSPLVLASLEPYFDEAKDQLFDFELEHDKVVLYDVTWANLGDIRNWLTSNIFNLRQARSREAEVVIRAAEAYMRGDNLHQFEKQGLTTKDRIHDQLKRVLADHDEFWAR
jgi:hypothetical protein